MSTLDIKKNKLLECLNLLSLKSGFESLEKFRTYKESINCFSGYKAVYPDEQKISTSDDKIYVDNLKIMTAQNLYDSKSGEMIKLSDKTSKSLNIN